MKKFGFIASLFVLVPAFALAATDGGDLGNLKTLAGGLGDIINTLIPVAFAAAILFFFYGLAMFILGDKSDAKATMGWGVVAIFIMASLFGIVSFLGDAIGLKNTDGGTFNPVEVKQ